MVIPISVIDFNHNLSLGTFKGFSNVLGELRFLRE